MKKLLVALVLILNLSLVANEEFTPFVSAQLKIINQMNKGDTTQKEMIKLVQEQELLYQNSIDSILSDKQEYIDNAKIYKSDIYALTKVKNLNKRLGNTYAVLRDEVRIKTYMILDAQTKMIQKLLKALNDKTFDEYQEFSSNVFAQNQILMSKIDDVDYTKYLKLDIISGPLEKAKKNIKDYYGVIEMNHDVIKYISFYDKKMYSLNEYAKYGLLGPVMKINNTQITKSINEGLDVVGLSIVKILFMLLVTGFIYIISKYLYKIIEKLIQRIKFIQKYSTEILRSVKKIAEFTLYVINAELVLYTYNDFTSSDVVSMFFGMSYSILFALVVYKIINTVASIKISHINYQASSIKSEIINVGIKIVNFIIFILGLLLVLHSAGVNLTAVLSGLGIGGFAVALAAKDSLANFFGTLSILLSDTFSQGDWIVADGVEGTVVEIGLRVTTIRTFDNALISIPNANLANTDIKNWNKRRLGRRIKMSLGVKYDSKSSDIKNAVEQIREMLIHHPAIATTDTKIDVNNKQGVKMISREDSHGIKKTLLVYLDSFNDSSINILVYCFSKTVKWAEWLEVKEDVMHKIMEIFEKNNLEFAFPSMSLYKEN